MKYLVFLLVFPAMIHSMEVVEEMHPKYHINNRVVFLQKSQEHHEDKSSIETQWQNANPEGRAVHTPATIATINTGVSNKTKMAIALIGGCSTVTAAIIAGLVTYYSAKC